MPYFPQLAVKRMPPRKERNHWSLPWHQSILRTGQANVPPRIFQSGVERLQRLFAPPRRRIHFRKIQIELRLVALHAYRRIAQSFRFSPLLLRARQHHAQVGHIIGIVFVQLRGPPHVRQRLHRVIVAQKRQSLLELAERFRIQHQFTSRDLEEFWNRATSRKYSESAAAQHAFQPLILNRVPASPTPPALAIAAACPVAITFRPTASEATPNPLRNLLTPRPVLGQRK